MMSARPFEKVRRNNCAYLFSSTSEFVVYDTETTGLDTLNDRIVQICAKRCKAREDGTVEVMATLLTYVKPCVPIGEKASKVSGITMDTVKDAPSEETVFPEIYEFFGRLPVCGYNIDSYDNHLMGAMYARYGKRFEPVVSLDVLEMARDVIPAKEKRNLSSIAAMYGVDGGSRAHDAGGDVDMCVRVLQCMREEYGRKPPIPDRRDRLYCNYAWFSNGFNKSQKGIYVATQFYRRDDKKKVNLWYSTADKCYYSAQIDPSQYDVDALTVDLMHFIGCSYPALQRMNKDTFEKCRKEKGRR